MSKKKINVSVSAPSASGKSTILWAIIKTLIEHGVDVDYPLEKSKYKSIEQLQNSVEHDFLSLSHKINTIKDNIIVSFTENDTI